MAERTWAGARFFHLDPGCPVCSGHPLDVVAFFRRQAAPVPAPFRNPESARGHWYHGTSFDPRDDEYDHDEDTSPGGNLRHPDHDEYESEWGQAAQSGKHWNTGLGVHFTSLHGVAEGFATGAPQYGAGHRYPQKTSRIAHTSLHMANPKHFPNEEEMGHAAITWAHQNGYHFLPKHPEAHEHFMAGDYERINEHSGDGGAQYDYLDHLAPHKELRQTILDIDQNGPAPWWRNHNTHSTADYDQYLGHHPHRGDIVQGFRKHLQDQGHDGITYGNEYEGPHGHRCAIAFPETHVHVHKWQWLHEDQEHLSEEPTHQDDYDPYQQHLPFPKPGDHGYAASLTKAAQTVQDVTLGPDDGTNRHTLCRDHADKMVGMGHAFLSSPEDITISHPYQGVCSMCEKVGLEKFRYENMVRDSAAEHGHDLGDFEPHPKMPSLQVAFCKNCGMHGAHSTWGPKGPVTDTDCPGDWTAHLAAVVNFGGQWYSPHQFAHKHPFLPTHRIFGEAKTSLDPRLFDGDKMKGVARQWMLGQIGSVWDGQYADWKTWARVYLAGSEATYWWGNNDLDTLIGIEHDAFREANPRYHDYSDEQIDAMLTDEFRHTINDEHNHVPWEPNGEEWHTTFYCNPNSWDIRAIKPYAAYEIISGEWFVRPPEVPKDWGPQYWDESMWAHAEAVLHLIESVMKLPEPDRTRQGAVLYDMLHGDRRRAFSDDGYGWTDPGNVIWKYLDQHEAGPLAFLIQCKHDAASMSNTPKAAAHRDPADQVDSSRYFVWEQSAPDHRRHLLNYDGEDDFPLAGLHTEQEYLSRKHIERYAQDDPETYDPVTIHVHKDEDGNDVPWVENGHHRAAAAMERGATHVFAHVYREEEPSRRQASLDPGHKPEFDPEADYETNHARKKAWTAGIRRAMSLGHLSPDEAHERGYHGMGHDQTSSPDWHAKHSLSWKPLPDTLYHVTTDAESVRQHGLKTRDELAQAKGKGLGGGDSDTVSFTTDPHLAGEIHDALHEFHRVVNGHKTIKDMLRDAKEGVGAEKPYLRGMVRYHQSDWEEGQPLPHGLQALADHRMLKSGMATQQEMDAKHGPGWEPHPGGNTFNFANGETAHTLWHRPMDEDEKREHAADVYKRYSVFREHAGGPSDPMFFSTDTKGFAKLDPSGFKVMKFRPKPGAQGFQMGAMSEWRTSSGDAVELDHEHKTASSKSVTIDYAHNTAKSPDMGERYGQHVEPHGRYLVQREPGDTFDGAPGWETGSVTFQNPLHIEWGGGYQEPSNWKHRLSEEHGGLTGRALSDALVAKGHDGIITHDEYGTREIVDLTGLHKNAMGDYDYRIQHQPPDADEGSGMHDPHGILPDVHEHPEYYCSPDYTGSYASHRALMSVKGQPEKHVNVYRAVPHGVRQINPGDWVTPSEEYARLHGMDSCPGCGKNMQVLKARVKAKHLHGHGDITEWGYTGDEPVKPTNRPTLWCPNVHKVKGDVEHLSDGTVGHRCVGCAEEIGIPEVTGKDWRSPEWHERLREKVQEHVRSAPKVNGIGGRS